TRRRTRRTRRDRAARADGGDAAVAAAKEGPSRRTTACRRRRLTSLLHRMITTSPHWSSRVKSLAQATANHRSTRLATASAAGDAVAVVAAGAIVAVARARADRKSTRLNSSHQI